MRRLFGRIAVRCAENPNLKDKVGREGLIDNKAGKVFRDLVVNILRDGPQIFRDRFGEPQAPPPETLGRLSAPQGRRGEE